MCNYAEHVIVSVVSIPLNVYCDGLPGRVHCELCNAIVDIDTEVALKKMRVGYSSGESVLSAFHIAIQLCDTLKACSFASREFPDVYRVNVGLSSPRALFVGHKFICRREVFTTGHVMNGVIYAVMRVQIQENNASAKFFVLRYINPS